MNRPDLAFAPPSGSAVPEGLLAVSWSFPPSAAGLRLVAGLAPGDSDLLADSLVEPPDNAVSLTVPGGARRVYVSAWLELPAGVSYAYRLTYWVDVGDDVAPETIVRRLLGAYWLEEWLGEDLDERRLCPARALGTSGLEISFSPDDAGDVFPWTPAEVRSSAGFALLRFRELDRFDDGVTAGEADGAVASGEYVLFALDFELAVPSKLADVDAVELLERRCAAAEAIFKGLALLPDAPPVLSIRNLARYPTRRRGGSDDGTWRRAYLTVQVRARVRRSHVGAKEVALP